MKTLFGFRGLDATFIIVIDAESQLKLLIHANILYALTVSKLTKSGPITGSQRRASNDTDQLSFAKHDAVSTACE
jgi:hypothetical protein